MKERQGQQILKSTGFKVLISSGKEERGRNQDFFTVAQEIQADIGNLIK